MPRVIGLTGGIGAGKSTVARMLGARGAVVVDADAITRDLQRAGTAVFEAIVARFGQSVVGPDGELDREALAQIVFQDEGDLEGLNAIVHPAVRDEMARQIAAAAPDSIVVLDIPLLAESTGRAGMAFVVSVESDPVLRVARLVRDRGMSVDAAQARIRAQATREERVAIADAVIDNDTTLEALEAAVDEAWARIQAH